MGFPIGYTDIFIPPLFLQTLTILTLFRNLLFSIFSSIGLSDFLDPYPSHYPLLDPSPTPLTRPPISAILTRQLLPIIKASHLTNNTHTHCSVCLYEVLSNQDIRFLVNCHHVFHKDCLDRWIDLDHYTCPLCRTPFLQDDLLMEFNQRLSFADHLDYYDVCSDPLHNHYQ